MKKFYTYILIAVLGLGLSSCEDLLEVDVTGNELTEEDAIQSKEDVLEILNSCYDVNANLYNGQIQYCGELLSDNLSLLNVSGDLGQIYNRNVQIFNGTVGNIYGEPYITIFRANRIRELLNDFDFSEQERNAIEAELNFLRAISHYEVVKLWAQPWGYTPNNSHPGVVYKTSTDVEVLPREDVNAVYSQVVEDLQSAINANALPQNDPYRASEYAARAYLAKVRFQQGEYALALEQADIVINSGRYRLDTLIDRFQPDTVVVPEIIFKTRSFAPSNDLRSGGFTSNYRSDVPQPPFFRASEEFWSEYQSDTLDRRVRQFFEVRDVGTPDEYIAVRKFNKVYFDVPILHLTDLKLLRAECLTLLGQDLTTAIQDVNDIRERAYGNSNFNLPAGSTSAQVLSAIRRERRIEMFGEGDRIQQLKRRGAIEGENIIIRDAVWNCDGMILQFPATERTEEFEINPQGGC